MEHALKDAEIENNQISVPDSTGLLIQEGRGIVQAHHTRSVVTSEMTGLRRASFNSLL
jgi:hypothetical protein